MKDGCPGISAGCLQHPPIALIDAVIESHWQLRMAEIAQKILRDISQRVWRISELPAEEVVEACAIIWNELNC